MAKAPAPSHPEEAPAHDPLAAALGPSPLEKFIEDNKVTVFGGIAAVVVGVSAAIWFTGTRAESELATAQAFSKASTLSDFDALIAQYPSSPVAGNALLRKAALLEDQGKTDEARAALVELRERHPRHALIDQATLALARLATNANELEKARDFLSEIPSSSDLAALAQLQLGDLAYQQGDLVKAKTIYEPIQANYPVNPWSQQVAERLQALKLAEAKAKTPAPVLPKAAEAAPAPSPAKTPGAAPAKTEATAAPKAPEKPEAKVEVKPAAPAKTEAVAAPKAPEKPEAKAEAKPTAPVKSESAPAPAPAAPAK